MHVVILLPKRHLFKIEMSHLATRNPNNPLWDKQIL
jgi:hypothetical protein